METRQYKQNLPGKCLPNEFQTEEDSKKLSARLRTALNGGMSNLLHGIGDPPEVYEDIIDSERRQIPNRRTTKQISTGDKKKSLNCIDCLGQFYYPRHKILRFLPVYLLAPRRNSRPRGPSNLFHTVHQKTSSEEDSSTKY